MQLRQDTNPSQIYKTFQAIEPDAHRAVIRFFERREDEILNLEFHEFFELLIAYGDALFKIGDYTTFIKVSNSIIEQSIYHNIQYHKDIDIYQHTLYQKAAAYYQIHHYKKAEHILVELVKINPKNKLVKRFLRKVMSQEKVPFVRKARAISVLLYLVAILIILVDILLGNSFLNAYAQNIRYLWMAFIVLGIVLLLFVEGIQCLKIYRKVNQIR